MANEAEVYQLFEHYKKIMHDLSSPLEQLKFKHMLAVVQYMQYHEYEAAKQLLFQLLKNMEAQQFIFLFIVCWPNITLTKINVLPQR